jgi:alpha-glucoside transport system ATP-binding protein
MTAISLRNISKAYGAHNVISNVDLDIEPGEFVVFVGPSGCGKSTLLRMIAGLEGINGGTISIDGAVANDIAPAKRGIAMVFQSYALYPHMNVYENLAFSLRIAHAPKAEIDRRVRVAADMLQLTPYLKRQPRELSGGQRQRVAIGRAIVREAKVFLFDEPLSNLDAALRVATRLELAKLKERLAGTTMIYVTHDQVEAMTLADRIVVLNGGRIEQVGTPVELYQRPRNLFVAGFIGSPAMNFVDVDMVVAGDTARLVRRGATEALPVALLAEGRTAGGPAKLGVRPESLKCAPADGALFSGVVDVVEYLGEVTIVYLRLDDGGATVLAKLEGAPALGKGDRLHLTARAEDLHGFDGDGLALRRA